MSIAKFSSAVLFPSLIILGGLSLHEAAAGDLRVWEKRQKRFEAESVALFQVILERREKEDGKKPSPCEFRAEWFEYAVPQGIAEEYFGSTVQADLSPPSNPGEPAEILDPKGAMREAFCTEKDDDEKLQTALESLKKGELKDGKEPAKSLRRLENYRLEYTIPIFDRHYRRAVVVSSGTRSLWWIQADGKQRRYFDKSIWASIYVKRKGRWHLLKDEPLAAGHGGT